MLLSCTFVQVQVYEEKAQVGGACKTEYPFQRAPELGTSTGSLLKLDPFCNPYVALCHVQSCQLSQSVSS